MHRRKHTFQSQSGWVLLELMMTLMVLALVIHLAQRQAQMHWQQVSQLQQQARQWQRQQALQDMRWLLQNPNWGQSILTDDVSLTCQFCQGQQLEQWFNTRF